MSKQKGGIFSVNVNGLNSPQKRKVIFNKLIKERVDIICIQETHIKEKDIRLIKKSKARRILLCSG